jgi:hypothetical protein
MFRPMLLLTRGVAILDKHTRLACFETDASVSAALGTAVARCIYKIIHHDYQNIQRLCLFLSF